VFFLVGDRLKVLEVVGHAGSVAIGESPVAGSKGTVNSDDAMEPDGRNGLKGTVGPKGADGSKGAVDPKGTVDPSLAVDSGRVVDPEKEVDPEEASNPEAVGPEEAGDPDVVTDVLSTSSSISRLRLSVVVAEFWPSLSTAMFCESGKAISFSWKDVKRYVRNQRVILEK
jgi:hypothetical protein